MKTDGIHVAHSQTTRNGDDVFYSSDGDTVYKNTASGLKTSLGLNSITNTGATVVATPNKIVLRDSDGDIFASNVYASNVHVSHSREIRNSDDVFYSSDGDTVYKNTAEGLKTSLGLNSITNAGATVAATPGKIVLRDSEGDIFASNVHVSHSREIRNSDNVFYSSDGDTVYKNTADGLKASLGLNNVTNTGATGAATPNKIVLRDSYGDIFATNVHADGSGYYHNLRALSNVYGQKFVSVGDDDTMMGFPIADTITMTTGGTERVRIDGSGNVGIGTVSPLTNLHIPTHDAHPVITIANATNPRYAVGFGARFINGIGQGIDFFTGDSNSNSTALNSSHRRMSITAQGNVGIGTDNPRQKLDITSGNIAIVNPSWKTSANDDQAAGRIHFYVGAPGSTELNTPVSTIVGYDKYKLNGGYEGALAFETQGVERMRIHDGNVGIGTTSPGVNLHVYKPSSPSYIKLESGGIGTLVELWMKSQNGNWALWNNGSDDKLRIWSGSDRMTITGSGNVGIGTTYPYAKLQINGAAGYLSETNGTAMQFAYNVWTWRNNASSYWGDAMSIYATDDIASGSYILSSQGTITSSDERIKKNIVDADDTECLETLRLLKPKKYQYKDIFKKGEEPVWGFIAQEVRETLPHATRMRREVLPNIYELASVSSSNVITFTNFNTSNLESNATTLIRTTGIDDKDHDIHLVEVLDEHTIRVEEDLSEWIGSLDETGNVVAGNQLFVYGQQVDDFVYLKKESIFTVATAALQEVDRQQQADKARIAELESRVTELEGMVSLIRHNMTWPDE